MSECKPNSCSRQQDQLDLQFPVFIDIARNQYSLNPPTAYYHDT
jgi:hypothetical protein